MTPNEITTLFASKLSKELDIPFKKMLYERVKYWRSTLIRQSLKDHPEDAKYFRQTIYIPMVRVNTLAIISPELEKWEAVSQVDIPLPLRVSKAVFNYVGGVDGRSPFGYGDVGTTGYLTTGKYANTIPYHEYFNSKFYVDKLPDLPYIRIDGVFNSPEEALVYATIPPQPDVDWWDMDIPISGDVEQRVIQCMGKVDYEDPGKEKTDDKQIPVNNEEL